MCDGSRIGNPNALNSRRVFYEMGGLDVKSTMKFTPFTVIRFVRALYHLRRKVQYSHLTSTRGARGVANPGWPKLHHSVSVVLPS